MQEHEIVVGPPRKTQLRRFQRILLVPQLPPVQLQKRCGQSGRLPGLLPRPRLQDPPPHRHGPGLVSQDLPGETFLVPRHTRPTPGTGVAFGYLLPPGRLLLRSPAHMDPRVHVPGGLGSLLALQLAAPDVGADGGLGRLPRHRPHCHGPDRVHPDHHDALSDPDLSEHVPVVDLWRLGRKHPRKGGGFRFLVVAVHLALSVMHDPLRPDGSHAGVARHHLLALHLQERLPPVLHEHSFSPLPSLCGEGDARLLPQDYGLPLLLEHSYRLEALLLLHLRGQRHGPAHPGNHRRLRQLPRHLLLQNALSAYPQMDASVPRLLH
mmetsp:Transcript_15120/g.33776  ORF Transcript_15120/g.33776 Transcript_15120/m.33776 type:complete len:322 (+) Transcript_15120:1593-2558(+)